MRRRRGRGQQQAKKTPRTVEKRTLWSQASPRRLSRSEASALRAALSELSPDEVAPAVVDGPYRVDVDPRPERARVLSEAPIAPTLQEDTEEEEEEKIVVAPEEEIEEKLEEEPMIEVPPALASFEAQLASSSSKSSPLSSWFLAGGPPVFGNSAKTGPRQSNDDLRAERRRKHHATMAAIKAELLEDQQSHDRLRRSLLN